MKILLVTVGTTAVANRGIGRAVNLDNKRLLGQVENFHLKPPLQRSIERNRSLFGEILEAHKRFWGATEEYRSVPANRFQTSAELLSSNVILNSARPSGGFAADRIVLISSDTPEGLFNAQLNAEVIRDCWKKDVRVALVPNLKEDRFIEEEKLWESLAESLAGGGEVAVNFTGGFKGLVPVLTVQAMKRGWAMFYQYEDSQEAVRIDLPKAAVTGRTRQARL